MPIQFSPALEPRELLELALQWTLDGQSIALLTLVSIEGSAPYPVGTQMLVKQTGEFAGQITGGCAEVALAAQAKQQIQKRINTVERYGLGSKFFDIQLPCGSGIDVHFDVELELESLQHKVEVLRSRESVAELIECAEYRFEKTYLPNERILIFGQGPIKTSLIDLATRCGFDVVAIDHTMNGLHDLNFSEICDRYTAIVSLFHEHDYEIDILFKALEFDLFYYGALGSRATHAKRLSQLRELGATEQTLEKIEGPIGLDIGAVSPAQIAISVLAQLISTMNQDGRFTN